MVPASTGSSAASFGRRRSLPGRSKGRRPRYVLTFEPTKPTDRPESGRSATTLMPSATRADNWQTRRGLPLGIRLLRNTRRTLLRGARGADKVPGEVRRSQNWIGGSRHGNARFVPPPPADVADAFVVLERWWHADCDLPPLVRAGLAHVQFETIHPFLDGKRPHRPAPDRFAHRALGAARRTAALPQPGVHAPATGVLRTASSRA